MSSGLARASSVRPGPSRVFFVSVRKPSVLCCVGDAPRGLMRFRTWRRGDHERSVRLAPLFVRATLTDGDEPRSVRFPDKHRTREREKEKAVNANSFHHPSSH